MEGNTHHCYLLQSLSSPSKTYIGYTVNPHRRIKQHNGIIKGGANYTSKFRPWKFICITEGFKSEQQGLKFEWAWQNPKRSLIFRSGLGAGGKGSSMALAGSLQKMGGPLGKLRLLMILLCESQDFQKEVLNLYFFEEGLKLDFEDLLRHHLETSLNGSEQCDDDDDESMDEVEKKMTFPRQMKIHLIDRVEEMPFFRQNYSQRHRDLILNNGDGSMEDNFSDRDNDIEKIDAYDDSMTSDIDLVLNNDAKNKAQALHFMDCHEFNENSSDSDDPTLKLNDSCLEHSLSSLSINKNGHECTIKSLSDNQTAGTRKHWNCSQKERLYDKTGCNSSSGRVIDLLDSSDDDDDDDDSQEQYHTKMLRDISIQSSSSSSSSSSEGARMNVCSPIRPSNTSMSVIDLTVTSPAFRHVNFGDDRDKSLDVIDLCSPKNHRL